MLFKYYKYICHYTHQKCIFYNLKILFQHFLSLAIEFNNHYFWILMTMYPTLCKKPKRFVYNLLKIVYILYPSQWYLNILTEIAFNMARKRVWLTFLGYYLYYNKQLIFFLASQILNDLKIVFKGTCSRLYY